MLKGLSIQNFRGIREGALEDLSQVNLLVGRNNSGKSTVLDALLLARAPFQPRDRLGINCFDEIVRRRVEREKYDFKELWYRYNSSQPFQLTLHYGPEQALPVSVTLSGSASFQIRVLDRGYNASPQDMGSPWGDVSSAIRQLKESLSKFSLHPEEILSLANLVLLDSTYVRRLAVVEQLWNEIKRGRYDKKVVDTLNNVYGLSIEYLEYVPDAHGQYRIHASMADRSLAIDTVGEGLRAAFGILSVLSLMKEAILLIEELETHQHPESLKKLVAVVFEYAKRNDLQLFMTTQSAELISYALEEATQRQLDLKLHHLDLDTDGKLSVRSLSLPDAKVLADVGPDLRTLYKYVS